MQKTMIISASILLIGVVAGVLIANPSVYLWRGGMMHNENHYSGGVQETNTTLKGNREAQGMGMMHDNMFITSERQFIEHMVPHHEEAIATAREVLEHGGTSQGMVDLANNIITSQTAEVALMKESYAEWFDESYQDTGEYEPMMRDLTPYDGVTLDRIFLHDMTMHHMGAIMMSRSVQSYLEHDVMRELTNNIIVNQSREIETMQQLYTQLR